MKGFDRDIHGVFSFIDVGEDLTENERSGQTYLHDAFGSKDGVQNGYVQGCLSMEAELSSYTSCSPTT